ncbi:hypothetical protein [Legionella fairfieldensis]|uniref:hypothetical protein n=1 Tax=Legionella fairfieldensis TaxID=45064 RepID=UPI0006876FCA|nr:hypothetical protein [Legionella fairfieldensis]
MEPVTITIICTVSFGVFLTLSAFIRQLLLSRDKRLNDKAQKKALKMELRELEKLRNEMKSKEYPYEQAEEIFRNKLALIARYDEILKKEAPAIIDEKLSTKRKELLDKLHEAINNQLNFYDNELEKLQKYHSELWKDNPHFRTQEKESRKRLSDLCTRHTAVLEKIYIRHMDSNEALAKQTIDASNQTFKLIMAPFEALIKYFTASKNISPTRLPEEIISRNKVRQAELKINEPDVLANEVYAVHENSSSLLAPDL